MHVLDPAFEADIEEGHETLSLQYGFPMWKQTLTFHKNDHQVTLKSRGMFSTRTERGPLSKLAIHITDADMMGPTDTLRQGACATAVLGVSRFEICRRDEERHVRAYLDKIIKKLNDNIEIVRSF
jgi:hypothetical protein